MLVGLLERRAARGGEREREEIEGESERQRE